MKDLVMNDEHLCASGSQLFLFDLNESELNLSIEGGEDCDIQAIALDKEMAEKLGKALLEWAQSR